MRYIPIDNGIQRHGRTWRYMVGAGQHSRKEARYTNATRSILVYDIRYAIYEHSIQPPSPKLRNARVRVSRARVCVRYIIILLYYYNIIILLYLYIPNIPSISNIPSIHNIPNIPNNGNIAL